MSAPIVSSGLRNGFTARDLFLSGSPALLPPRKRLTLTRRVPFTVKRLVDVVLAKNATIRRDKQLNDTLRLKLLQDGVITHLNNSGETDDVEMAPAPVARSRRTPLGPVTLRLRPRAPLRAITNRTPIHEVVTVSPPVRIASNVVVEWRTKRQLEVERVSKKKDRIREKLIALKKKKGLKRL